MSRQSPFEVSEFIQPAPKSAAELLPALDESVAKAKEILRSLDDAELGKTWRATAGGKEIHHRGQLSVYLRQVGALVPSIYGPSADENPFAREQPRAAAV
jgi:uncharacterized damage-inducible protein DinB